MHVEGLWRSFASWASAGWCAVRSVALMSRDVSRPMSYELGDLGDDVLCNRGPSREVPTAAGSGLCVR